MDGDVAVVLIDGRDVFVMGNIRGGMVQLVALSTAEHSLDFMLWFTIELLLSVFIFCAASTLLM